MLVTADQWRGLEISGREWTAETEKSREDLKQALRDRREDQKQENEEKEEREEEVTAKEYEAASDSPRKRRTWSIEWDLFSCFLFSVRSSGILTGYPTDKSRQKTYSAHGRFIWGQE
jgi:hypothetical protein